MTLLSKDLSDVSKTEGIVTVAFYGSGGSWQMTEDAANLLLERLQWVLKNPLSDAKWGR